jgi:hypothetical protein
MLEAVVIKALCIDYNLLSLMLVEYKFCDILHIGKGN